MPCKALGDKMLLKCFRFLGYLNIAAYLVGFSYVIFIEKINNYSDEYNSTGFFAIAIILAMLFGYLPMKLLNLMSDPVFFKKIADEQGLDKAETLRGGIWIIAPSTMILSLLMFSIFFIPKGVQFVESISR